MQYVLDVVFHVDLHCVKCTNAVQDAVHDAVHHNVNYAWHKVRNHDLHRCSIMFSTMVCTVGILHYVECTMLGSVICSMLGRRVCPCFKQKNVKLIGIRKPLVIIFIMHACETLFKITYTVRCGLARLCKNAYNPTKTVRNFQNSQNIRLQLYKYLNIYVVN